MLTDARQAISDAVTESGLACSPYAPGTLVTPAAFVDVVTVAYDEGVGWFCAPGQSEIQLVTVDQRNDSAAALAGLEDRVRSIVGAVQDLGVTVLSVASGSVEIGGQTLPAVTYTLRAHI